MSPEAQRIGIAEACGWKRDGEWLSFPRWKKDGMEYFGSKDNPLLCIPDYLNDLNAMHEAEKVLTDEQCEKYWIEMNALLNVWAHGRRTWVFETPAAQRAEAFLKTLGLGKEEVVSDTKVA